MNFLNRETWEWEARGAFPWTLSYIWSAPAEDSLNAMESTSMNAVCILDKFTEVIVDIFSLILGFACSV